MRNFFIALQFLLPQILLTNLLRHVMNWSQPVWFKNALIRWVINHYKIDVSLAADPDINNYKTFNDFFIRHLKPDVRPLATDGIISPVDGAISQIGAIDDDKIIQAKGISYTLNDLLANQTEFAEHFRQGKFTTLYLAPKDYHRVHMPIAGKLLQTIYVPGQLFSVNQITAENVVNLFARNERLICEFDTELGPMVMIFVGALFVAGIHTAWAGDIKRGKEIVITDYHTQNINLQRGDEAGYFKFGSTIILLFGANSIEWEKSLYSTQPIIMGQKLADKL